MKGLLGGTLWAARLTVCAVRVLESRLKSDPQSVPVPIGGLKPKRRRAGASSTVSRFRTTGDVTKKEAHLVAGQLPVPGRRRGIRDGRGESVGIGVVGDDEFGIDLAGQGIGFVEGTGLLRFGKVTVGKSGSGVFWEVTGWARRAQQISAVHGANNKPLAG